MSTAREDQSLSGSSTEVIVSEYGPSADAGKLDIELRISADPAHLSVVRAVAADLAMRADFDLDAISDLKMAVDEVCSELVSRAVAGAVLVCRFGVEGEQIHFTAEAPVSSPSTPSRESFGWRVLAALTDAVNTWVVPDGEHGQVLRMDLLKRRVAAVER